MPMILFFSPLIFSPEIYLSCLLSWLCMVTEEMLGVFGLGWVVAQLLVLGFFFSVEVCVRSVTFDVHGQPGCFLGALGLQCMHWAAILCLQVPVLFLRNTRFHSAQTMLSCGQCRGSAQAVAATRTFCIVCLKLLLGKIGQECWMKMGKLWQQAVYRLQFV